MRGQQKSLCALVRVWKPWVRVSPRGLITAGAEARPGVFR